MRPVSQQGSVLQHPMDSFLGSEAHVRLLRVLSFEADRSLGVTDAARRAGVTPQGARKAFERLEHSGAVQRVGTDRAFQYRLRIEDPAVAALVALFSREQDRYEDLIAGLRQAVTGLPEVREAWVQRMPLQFGQPIELVAVVETTALPWIAEELRSRLIGLESEFNLIVEVALFTRADAPTRTPDALSLWVTEARESAPVRSGPQTHDQAEARSLQVARGIAELIRSDPSLIKRAGRYLARLVREDQGISTGDLAEWQVLLQAYSPERVRDLLVSDSPRATRLRQSSPFLAVLTSDERDRLLELVGSYR